MNLPDIPLFAMLRERMSWLNQRQGVLSQNVANADTPGYGARDLKAPDFETLLRNTVKGTEISSGLRTTNSKHIALQASAESGGFTDFAAPDVEASLNGNSVSPSRVRIVAMFVSVLKPAPSCVMSLATTMSSPLLSIFDRE